MKIITIVGARPQFIKAATVTRVISELGAIEESILHTGQHYDHNMSDIFFDELGIPSPRWNLGVVGQNHGEQTGKMLSEIEPVLLSERPNLVMVYGDTNSTLAGALAASKLHIPVAHVEAGLRSFNKKMPEEINRILTDHCSDILFSTSPLASKNLQTEGIDKQKIVEVGDVMFDSTRHFTGKASLPKKLAQLFQPGRKTILATIHRAENTADPVRIRAIFDSMASVSTQATVICPLHPRTLKSLSNLGELERYQKTVRFIDPLGYLEMIALESASNLIVTDSGGVQKEAYYAGVPCVTLRDETEWTELIDIGVNELVSPSLSEKEITVRILDNLQRDFSPNSTDILYGGGRAASLISKYLANFLSNKT